MKKILVLLISVSLFVAGCGASRKAARRSSKNIEGVYAKELGVSKESISNKKLYSFINEWYGVRYKYAGKTKNGVDCSGFVSILYKEVFQKEISGPAVAIYNQCKPIPKEELKEGDLVFFEIGCKGISHIGVYLQNNKFVHTTTKKGVMIDDLNEEYYLKYFKSAGRIKG